MLGGKIELGLGRMAPMYTGQGKSRMTFSLGLNDLNGLGYWLARTVSP